MSNFGSVIKTNINNLKLNNANKSSISGSQNNTYQDYEEIDYNVPVVTTAPKESANTVVCTVYDDSDDLYLKKIYNYYSTTTTTTTAVADYSKKNDSDKEETISKADIKRFIQNINSNYSRFKSMLVDNIQQMGPIGSYVPQGVCNVNEFTLVSCYDGNKEKSPRVLIIDSIGNKRWIDLDLPTNTHVGGITYDPINNNIWITGSDGEVGIYSYNSIINNNGKPAKAISNIQGNVMNANGNKVASYTTYYDGKIYVGSFNENDKGDVKEYTIGQDGRSVVLTNEFTVPNKAQGISFTKQNGKTYMAVSCSYGRFNDSSLELYEYSGGNINKIDDIKMPPMLEQVTFNEDGTLKCVFESNAKKYDDATVKIPSVCSLNISGCLK